MFDIYSFLEEHQISYQRFDHPPVFTCEEARRLLPHFPGAETKNLFLKDKKGKRHFLVVFGYEKSIDLKRLGQELHVKSLSLASAERLTRFLGLEPGSVTILGVVHDRESLVEVLIDRDLYEKEAWGCHPLVNTSTLLMARTDILRVLDLTGHVPRVLDLPATLPIENLE